MTRAAATGGPPTAVLWHDLECASYTADLALWRELAASPARPPGPILDVGAGTGRVALDLARAGHEVVALDRDEELLRALRERGGGLGVQTVTGDARSFELDRAFALVLAPMQIVQLLGGPQGVAGFLRAAAAHLRPGGVLAAALARAVPFGEAVADDAGGARPDGVAAPTAASPTLGLPSPDLLEAGGWLYASQPVAVRTTSGGAWLERRREAVAPDGSRSATMNRVLLDALAPDELLAAGRHAGLRGLAPRSIGATEDHVGSAVVLLEAPR